ncbi:MAG: hypothetical protein WCY87_03230 [Candidatus Cloacimonadales bacterium]|jgi:hypothetical protein|nr:hypothetical protein [Candidatus Cloacimonadota bacterium]MDY0381085.1 hypothetical protein [Candidatus Cloacimonadaceae bacterium]HCM16180.1 hypothetical protein [Candidatus Cloacimonas sp.]MCB5257159.1 hypothetical protein [Candidatus Cloacimonadota bacterium]MCB5263424.1 hypothetical protein [Candidatus Cloacimonadota bacterium]
MKHIFLPLFTLIFAALYAQSQLPITSYDYAIPENNVSAIALSMGGINVTDPTDPFASYGNPALLANSQNTTLYLAYRIADEKDIAFWDAVNVSNFLSEKQFKYFTLAAKQVAFSYQPMAAINISEYDAETNKSMYYDYKLDKVQLSLGITDKSWPDIAAGLNLKYLSGRLVYLVEHLEGSQFVRDQFIDDKVKGFSTDLGFTLKRGDTVFGLTAYDLISRLWWENYPAKSVQRRIAAGVQYGSGTSKTSFGIQSKLSSKPETSYHLGYCYNVNWDSSSLSSDESVSQGLDIRVGAYSQDFYGADNINFTLGSGYYYRMFRFDFSLNSKGLKLADSEFLFSLGLGF